MELYDRAKKAADYISSKIKEIPDTAVVLGSGLDAFGNTINVETKLLYSEIPEFPITTVVGHSGEMICGTPNGGNKRIIALKGRFHLYEGHKAEDATLYIRVLRLLGVKNLILTNAAGAINLSFRPGDLMLITDHLSFFCDSPLFGKNDDRFGMRFPPMENIYQKDLRLIAKQAAEELGIDLKEGVYCYSKGPMFETPAEIKALRTLGADACGMSTVPEAIVAEHSGLHVLGISCLSNMAAGITDQPLSYAEVIETGKATESKFKALMTKICDKL